MAPRNTAKKRAAGGVATRVSGPLGSPAVSPAPESPATTSPEESEVSRLEVHSPWCMICRDGAEGDVVLYECNTCPWVMCNKCIDVPSDSLQLVACPNVLFQCLACHSQWTIKEPAPFHGFYQGSLPAQGGQPALPGFLRLNRQHKSIRAYAHAQEAHIADLKSHLGHSGHVFVFFSDHSEEDSGWVFAGKERGKFVAMDVSQVLSTVLGPYHTILKGAIMVFLVCGSLVAHEDTFGDLQEAILNYDMVSAVIFPAAHFQPLVATNFLLAMAELVIIEQLDLHKAFPSLLSLSSHLGQHTKLLVTTFCPLCGSTKSWSERVAVVLHDESVDLDAQDQAPVSWYLYYCTYPHCGKAQGKPCHKFHIDKPPGFMVNAAKSKTSGWFQSPSTIFPLPPSVLSLPIISASSSTQGKHPRSSDGKGSTEKRMCI
ncbi:hypothetical protein DFH29DRAFT_1002932 [Suillus ampliporus]|nr:hypothetical protein DFH29DRAFT_1002932 [Suillus ampliporus]